MTDTTCTTTEAAKMLGVCSHTIRKLADRGLLKFYRIPSGKRRIVLLSSVNKLLSDRERQINGDKPQVA